jgi:hypothetical protein
MQLWWDCGGPRASAGMRDESELWTSLEREKKGAISCLLIHTPSILRSPRRYRTGAEGQFSPRLGPLLPLPGTAPQFNSRAMAAWLM